MAPGGVRTSSRGGGECCYPGGLALSLRIVPCCLDRSTTIVGCWSWSSGWSGRSADARCGTPGPLGGLCGGLRPLRHLTLPYDLGSVGIQSDSAIIRLLQADRLTARGIEVHDDRHVVAHVLEKFVLVVLA